MSPEQLAHALRGVEGVPPGNVASIAGSGAWWVPLRGPGMPAPYDPRGLHSGAAPAALAASSAPSAR